MTTLYNIRDQRNIALSPLSTNTTLGSLATVTLGPLATSGFLSLVVNVQSASLSVNIVAQFSNDNVTYQTTATASFGGTSLNEQFVFAVTGNYCKISLVNLIASTVAINVSTFGSQCPALEFRTQNDPFTAGDSMLLTKNLLTGSLPATGNYNVNLRAPGSLLVGKYDASMRQQITPPKWSASFPVDVSSCNIAKYSSPTITITPSGHTVNITTTGDTYFETNRGSPYGSINDTFVLRFNAAFLSGITYLLFGDQYIGVGLNGGYFGIKYYSGAEPQIYSQAFNKSLTGSATESFTFGPTTVPTMSITEVIAAQAANVVFQSDSTMTASFLGDKTIFRRTGAATSTSASSRTGADVFYTGQPTLISGAYRSTDVFIASSQFNIDKMDGTGVLPSMPPANGIAGELIFTADGNIMLMIIDPRNGILTMVHRANLGVRIFSGLTSKLAARVNNASITINDFSLYTYSEPCQRTRSVNTLQLSTFWPNYIAPPESRYIYLANVTATKVNTYITAINLYLQQGVNATVYLLTNTSMLPSVTGQNSSNEYVTISQASDGTYAPVNETYLISQNVTNYQSFTDAVIAKKSSDGSFVSFIGGDDFQADFYDTITVAIKLNSGMGTIKYKISVEYTY